MRLLKFNVNAQKLTKDPECDFTNLVAGTKKYLKAHFNFSKEWEDCVVIAQFWRGSNEHAVRVDNNECDIPPEVLDGISFRVNLIGIRADGYTITSNRVAVRQEVTR